jgi:hypothetical protein
VAWTGRIWYDLPVSFTPSWSWLAGKKLIPCMEKEKCGIWPYEEEKQYAEFVIGLDENGEPVSYTCNPEVLTSRS